MFSSPTRKGLRSIAISVSVCLSLCVCTHISKTAHPNLNKFSAGPASCPHVSLLWRRQCNALYTLCSEKRPTLFLEWLCQKLTDFYMILGVLSREKIWHERLTDLFTSLSGVRSHFQQWSYSKNEKVSVFGTRCTSSFMDDVVFARVLKESNVKPYARLLCLEYCVINWY